MSQQFGSDLIPTSFRLQAEKWHDATLAHVSNTLLVVHHFIRTLVEEACPDKPVREELWSFLLDELTECYRRSMDHARFLLHVELDGKAVTCNPEFGRSLQEARQRRLRETYADLAAPLPSTKSVDVPGNGVPGGGGGTYLKLDDLLANPNIDDGAGDVEAICGRIHDVMRSYYEVARSRFVDNICTQAVDHFLLSGKSSPLHVFGPERVLTMTDEQLDMIAGEDTASRNRRNELNRRIELLEEAKKIFRG